MLTKEFSGRVAVVEDGAHGCLCYPLVLTTSGGGGGGGGGGGWGVSETT